MSLSEYLRRTLALTVSHPGLKWFGAWFVATLEVCIGPLDRGLLQVLFGLFLLDTTLGILLALLEGQFRCKRLSYAAVKGAVYFVLLSAAWLFRRSGDLQLLPAGVALATGLEGFLLLTEGLSVLRNANKTLQTVGVDTARLRKLFHLLEEEPEAPERDPERSSKIKRLPRRGGRRGR